MYEDIVAATASVDHKTSSDIRSNIACDTNRSHTVRKTVAAFAFDGSQVLDLLQLHSLHVVQNVEELHSTFVQRFSESSMGEMGS